MTIVERRAALTATLAELERDRGAATLDGKAYDAARLTDCRAELEALDAAEAEASRRERAAEAAREAQRQAEARKALSGALGDYLTALERAEKACRGMVTELARAEELTGAMRDHVRAAGGMQPVSLSQTEIRNRHSAMLATVLRQMTGVHRFGAMKWTSVEPISDWTAWANKAVGGAVQPIIEGQ